MTSDQKKIAGVAAVGLLAFGWGWAKNRTAAKRQFAGVGVLERERHKAEQLNPRRLATSLLAGPFFEEWAFRGQLQGALSGLGVPAPAAAAVAAAAFGMAHKDPADKGRELLDEPSRAVDATLGGLMYSAAFALGGLPGAVAAHGLHNLGSTIGWSMGIDQAP